MIKGTELFIIPPDTVKAVRLSLNLTPEEFSERVGVTKRSVYFWERKSTTGGPPSDWEDEDKKRRCTGSAKALVSLIANQGVKDGLGPIAESMMAEGFEDYWVSKEEYSQLVEAERLRAEAEKLKLEAEKAERLRAKETA